MFPSLWAATVRGHGLANWKPRAAVDWFCVWCQAWRIGMKAKVVGGPSQAILGENARHLRRPG